MKVSFITFRSVTYAQRGERVLLSGGIRSQLQRTPRWMEEQGCGYCLRLREEDRLEAAALLQRAGVPFRRIYLQGRDGSLEEMP